MAEWLPGDRALRRSLAHLGVVGAVVAAVALLAPALLGGSTPVVQARELSGRGAGRVVDGGDFVLVAAAADLEAGVRVDLVVTVENPGAEAIDVQRIELDVDDAGAACRGAAVEVAPWRGSLPIPAEDRRTVIIPVRLRADAGAACDGAVFPVSLRGHAIRAM